MDTIGKLMMVAYALNALRDVLPALMMRSAHHVLISIISTKITAWNVRQIAKFVWMVLLVRNALKIRYWSQIYAFLALIQHMVVLQAVFLATKKIILLDVLNVMDGISWMQIMESAADVQTISLGPKDAEMRPLQPNVLMTMMQF